MGKNVTIIGGGSSSFVPILLRRLIPVSYTHLTLPTILRV